jgi:acyl-CoA synthetase (NDP forming)
MQVVKRMPGIAELDRLGVPTYARVEEALHGLDALVPRAPAPLATAGPAPGTPAGAGAYHDARAVLAAAGIPFPDGALAADDDDVARIATGLGGTVALKAVSADLLHKSDAGGVALSLATPDAARHGAVAMRARVRAARPDVVLDGVFVERMAEPGGVDLVVGAHRDPTFGPVILVGVGGIFVEILDDVVLAVAPADPGHVERLIGELKAAPLLAGARGSRPVDVAAIARAACTLGDLLLARPEILEVEINPLRASFAGILALDARIVVAR